MTDNPIKRGLGLEPGVTEQSLPGIGHRYDVPCDGGDGLTVVIHHSGRRDLYLRRRGKDSGSITLSDRAARTLGAILSGAYFKPAVVEEVEEVIGGLLIDWVTVDETSPAAGRSIAELEIRQRTGMTVAAILRDGEATVAPGPSATLEVGDTLVVMGKREDLAGLVRLVGGSGGAGAGG